MHPNLLSGLTSPPDRTVTAYGAPRDPLASFRGRFATGRWQEEEERGEGEAPNRKEWKEITGNERDVHLDYL